MTPLRVLIACPDRARLRSTTFPGIANAASDQWGGWAQERNAG